MNIIFYNNKSEPNYVNKDIEKRFELVGTLRNSTSVLSPIIIIEFETTQEYVVYGNTQEYVVEDTNTRIVYGSEMDNELLVCNYLYIPEFHRYYFIDDITSIRNGLWEISLSCDELMSFKEDFLKLDAYITRQEFKGDYMLPDSKLPIKLTPKFTSKDFEIPKYMVNMQLVNDDQYCICLIASTDINYGDDIYNRAGMVEGTNIVYFLTPLSYAKLCKKLVDGLPAGLASLYENVRSSIIGVYKFPISFIDYDKSEYIHIDGYYKESYYVYDNKLRLGNLYVEDIDCYRLQVSFARTPYIDIGTVYLDGEDNFFNYAPYRECTLTLPYLGRIQIDSTLLNIAMEMGSGISILLLPDIFTGKALYDISTFGYDQVEEFNYAKELPILSSDSAENLLRGGIGLVSTALTGLTMRTGGEITGETQTNKSKLSHRKGKLTSVDRTSTKSYERSPETFDLKGYASKVTNSAIDVVTGMQGSLRGYGLTSGGSNAGFSWINQQVRLKIKDVQLPDNFDYTEYAHHLGIPCQSLLPLKELSGYTEVGSIHLDNIKYATADELGNLENQLKSGVIF